MAEPRLFTSGITWEGTSPRERDDPTVALAEDAFASAGFYCDEPELVEGNPDLAIAAPAPLALPASAGNRARTRTTIAFSLFLHVSIASAFLATASQHIDIAGDAAPSVTLLGFTAVDLAMAGDEVEVTLIAPSELPRQVEPTEPTPPEPAARVVPEPVPALDEPAPEAASEAPPPTAEPEPEKPVEVPWTTAPLEALASPPPAPSILSSAKADPTNTAPIAQEEHSVRLPVVAPRPASQPATQKARAPEKKRKQPVAPKPMPERTKPAEPTPKAGRHQPVPSTNRPARSVTDKAAPAQAAGTAMKPAAGGRAGRSRAHAAKGAADGTARAKATTSGKAFGRNLTAGNAAATNYPGKVAAKLRRAVRSVSRQLRATASNDVHVSFVVSSAGGVGSIRIARSSGSPELDAAALAIVRRAAPFPSIPAEARRTSWAFAFPLGLAR
ncbi:TonB family protein [Mesorhizobium sp. NBSH29]|nr:TonB family protein [Mesorhizobium sp. NBSH29]